MTKLYVIFLFIFTFTLHAEEEFQPFMLTHKTKGCPDNSYCKSEQAQKQMKWKDSFTAIGVNKTAEMEKIRNSMGAPVSLYFATENPTKGPFILWDSRCKNHKKAKPKIYEAQTFLKKFPLDNKEVNVLYNEILIAKKNTIEKMTISSGDYPLFYEDQSLYINREQDGVYYGVKIHSSGNYNIIPAIQTKLNPSEIKCPEDLVEKFRKIVKNKHVYSSAICRKIWDRKQEVFHTYIIGEPCF